MTTSNAKPETPLDEALVEAIKEPKHGSFFYDLFLNEEVFFPVQKAGADVPTGSRLGLTETFFPLFLKFEKTKAIPVFDTLQRMQAWAGDKVLDYAVVQGYQLIEMAGGEVAFLLNLNTPFQYTFTSEIVSRLRNAMKPVSPS